MRCSTVRSAGVGSSVIVRFRRIVQGGQRVVDTLVGRMRVVAEVVLAPLSEKLDTLPHCHHLLIVPQITVWWNRY